MDLILERSENAVNSASPYIAFELAAFHHSFAQGAPTIAASILVNYYWETHRGGSRMNCRLPRRQQKARYGSLRAGSRQFLR